MNRNELKPVFELEDKWIPTKREQFLVENHIIPWANSLNINFPILDLAGGSGLESKAISQYGFSVVLTDLSKSLLVNGQYHLSVRADAEDLPFTNEAFSGILFKDVWVFLAPDQRMSVLMEMYRTLKHNGSIFLMSQLNDGIRIHYIPKNSKYPQKSICSNWEEYLKSYFYHVSAEDHIFSIEYLSTVEDTFDYANKVGFVPKLREEYRFDSQIAIENKWIERSGFIVELYK